MQSSHRARRTVAACLAALVATPAVLAAAPAAVAATDEQREASVAAGVGYLRGQQAADGRFSGFGGDYALAALAAAGVHPADVRTSTIDPSAQDFYAGSFAALTTPSSTAVLFGSAAGLDVQRLAPQTNLVAALAGAYNRSGDLEGSFGNGATNTATFTVLALARTGGATGVLARAQTYLRAPQHLDGG